MIYKICVKSSLWPEQFLPITKNNVLNFVFADSGSLQLLRFHKLIGQFTTYCKGLVCLILIRKIIHYCCVIEFIKLCKIPQHLVQPYDCPLVS